MQGLALVVLSCFLLHQVSMKDGKPHGKPLSDKEHHDDVDHDYDHEAFLGKDEAAEFDELAPEESKRRLGIIVDKIDKDSDGRVTLVELKNWIKQTQQRHQSEIVKEQWNEQKPKGKNTMKWEDYRKKTYEEMHGKDDEEDDENEDPEFSKTMEKRDQRRWEEADTDKNGELNLEEYAAFMNPEEFEHMHGSYVLEALEDMDKNNDGKLNIEEYIGDLGGEDDDSYVSEEKEHFNKYDKNGDGFMDLAELKEWIIDPDYDHSETESKHLVDEADENKDGSLTKAEILEKYDVFVGSQITNYGEDLQKHDEF